MKNLLTSFVLFTVIFCTPSFCISQELNNKDTIKSNTCQLNDSTVQQPQNMIKEYKTNIKCLEGKEFSAIKLDKGRAFSVKSLQPMSIKTLPGTIVSFESLGPEYIFENKEPAKLLFIGEILDNRPPGKGGSSGKIKIQITKIKVETITYPVSAFISKMNKKPVLFGLLGAPSNYVPNLIDTANNEIIPRGQLYKDPCSASECIEDLNIFIKPAYYLTGAFLEMADLLLCPIVALLGTGQDLIVPENTEFEIKLEEPLSVLNLDETTSAYHKNNTPLKQNIVNNRENNDTHLENFEN